VGGTGLVVFPLGRCEGKTMKSGVDDRENVGRRVKSKSSGTSSSGELVVSPSSSLITDH